jgi:Raf kinase inhibitor-like YbhB/YbcL family protein
MKFALISPVFTDGGTIPTQYTCKGADISPPLQWTNAPASTRSFALVVDDPDAPSGTWVHWVLYDIPNNVHETPEGIPKQDQVAKGGGQGMNDFKKVGYGGPCPPPGPPHRYYFRLYALDTVLNLKPRATKVQLLEAAQRHILAEATLIGRFGR